MALVNVIIPVYNCEQYVRQAVESVLNQPMKDISVFLVNDGSTDGSGMLCDLLAEQFDRVTVLHQTNQGVSAARNHGIDKALSVCENQPDGYIAFLDADDLWCSGVVTEELGKTMRSAQKPDMFAFGMYYGDSNMMRFSQPVTYVQKEEHAGHKSIWNLKSTFWTNFYELHLFRRWGIRFFEGMRYSEDKIFQMQCAFLSEKIRFMPQCLYVYRANPVSAMSKIRMITAIEYYLPIIDGWVRSDEFVNRWELETGKHIYAGSVLAGIYLLDMAAEHFKQGGSVRELLPILYNNPHFHLLEHMRPQDVSKKQYANRRLLLKQPTFFALKYRLIGAIERPARAILRLTPVQKWIQKRKFPLLDQPN